MRKKVFFLCMVLYCTKPLLAMCSQYKEPYDAILKLTAERISYGKIIQVPERGGQSACILNRFLITFIRNNDVEYPSLELFIKTTSKRPVSIDSMECPLLPDVTSITSFVHLGQLYDLSVVPTTNT